MVDAAAVLEALELPAAVFAADGALAAANGAWRAGAPDLSTVGRLRPGERLETPRADGSTLLWKARALPGGGWLTVGEPGVLAGPASRERYLAALSHELRTPLNGVLGMTGLLGRTRLDADQLTYVAALRDSGEHLLSLVNDVLDLAKLESGRLDLEPQPLDIERLLQGVAELLSPRAYEKRIEIAWAVPAGLPQVVADEGRLRQILFNLAGNAVKFTEAGGVLLGVEGAPQGAGRLRLRFTVRDTGPGVPEADQARIFDEFARLAPQERLEGAGLGLAIVRRLALAHEGVVGVSSGEEGGAVFWFEADFPTGADASAKRPLAGVSVAIASANPVVREAAVRQVHACGGRAYPYPGLAGLEGAPREAVLLVDHALKAAGRSFKPPEGRRALVLLAPEERASIARCRKAGFAGYLIKPLRRASVAERVLAVAGTDRRRTPRAATALADERIAAAAGSGLNVLLAEDNPINALLARALLEREGCTVHRAANGAEAVEATKVAAYDLILMDLRMPVMDGLQAAAALRAAGVRSPIVALTADAFADDRKACLAAGMNDFLTKPLDAAALRGALGRWAGFTGSKAGAKLAS